MKRANSYLRVGGKGGVTVTRTSGDVVCVLF